MTFKYQSANESRLTRRSNDKRGGRLVVVRDFFSELDRVCIVLNTVRPCTRVVQEADLSGRAGIVFLPCLDYGRPVFIQQPL